MTLRIALLDDYQQLATGMADWASLPQDAAVQTFDKAMSNEDDLVRALQDFDVVVAMRERTAFPASLIARLPKLRLLCSTGLRNAAIDVDACVKQGITVCGAKGSRHGLAATAETAWALIFSLHKRLVASHQALQAGRWQPQLALGMEGKVLGLAGLGKIGQRMANTGQAFGMEVVAWSPHLTAERAGQAGVRLVSKAELFALADVVSLHLVLSASTANIVAEAELAAMKPGAFLVNTSRAGLVSEAALMSALQQRRIGGAGLDVYWQEPLPAGHLLCTLDNVVMTPHLGYVTDDNMTAFYGNVLENIKAWIEGRPVVPLSS
ncbi:MAG: D-2-hydroxyacid dehydrogenase family protein [Polaromonas sp.]|nr:D-2-hydroxyacid dehydrogenase family protein [Polaromonas sp.]